MPNISENLVGCPSRWPFLLDDGVPYVNHDWNCWNDASQAQWCLSCLPEGDGFDWVCDNDFLNPYVNDPTCGGSGCNCILKPIYSCMSDIISDGLESATDYGADIYCQSECTDSNDFCVNKHESCCLHNFPNGWFTEYNKRLWDWGGVPYDFEFNFYLDNNLAGGDIVGNSGPEKIWDEESPYYAMPVPLGDLDENGYTDPYSQPIIAIFGENCSGTGSGDGYSLVNCSQCSGQIGVDDCDIRGLLPRFENIPIMESFYSHVTPNTNFHEFLYTQYITEANDLGIIDSNGVPTYIGMVCDTGPNEGNYCERSSYDPEYHSIPNCGGVEFGNPPDCEIYATCTHNCVKKYSGPPTVFQRILSEVGAQVYNHYLLYWDNPYVPGLPGLNDFVYPFPDDDSGDTRYFIPTRLNSIGVPERLLLKMYDNVTQNIYELGCLRTGYFGDGGEEYLISSFGIPDTNSLKYEIEGGSITINASYSNGDIVFNQNYCEVLGCTDPEACNFDYQATIDDGTCWYGITWYEDVNYNGIAGCTNSVVQCDPPSTNWYSECDDNEDETCESGITDDCGYCIENEGDGNQCYGTLVGSQCACLGEAPCWQSSRDTDSCGDLTGYDCGGVCDGNSVHDPCNIGYLGHNTDDFGTSCVPCQDEMPGNQLNMIECFPDNDRDGHGCCEGTEINMVRVCPGYNSITGGNHIDDCPCPSDVDENDIPIEPVPQCYSNNNDDIDDECNGFPDGCGNCHYNNELYDLWHDCRDNVLCIQNEDGYKPDDCGVCMSMQCCDTQLYSGQHDCGDALYVDGKWNLPNGTWIDDVSCLATGESCNPCKDLFGNGYIPINPDWNLSCVDCLGYSNGPNSPDSTALCEYFGDEECVTHCCKENPWGTDEAQRDVCGVCLNAVNTFESYIHFSDNDADGLAYGLGQPICIIEPGGGVIEGATYTTHGNLYPEQFIVNGNWYGIPFLSCELGSLLGDSFSGYYCMEDIDDECASNDIDCGGTCDGVLEVDECGFCGGPGPSVYYIDFFNNNDGYGPFELCPSSPGQDPLWPVLGECEDASWVTFPGGNIMGDEIGYFYDTPIGNCTNPLADNYICNLMPCIGECEGQLQDTPHDVTVTQDDGSNCIFLNMLSPSEIYSGLEFVVSINGQQSSNHCTGVNDASGIDMAGEFCYHGVTPSNWAVGNGYSASLEIYRMDSTGNTIHEIIHTDNIVIDHQTQGVTGYSINNYLDWDCECDDGSFQCSCYEEGDNIRIGIYYPLGCRVMSEEIDLPQTEAIDTSSCVGWEIKDFTVRNPVVGCKDSGGLYSCDVDCIGDVCVGGPCLEFDPSNGECINPTEGHYCDASPSDCLLYSDPNEEVYEGNQDGPIHMVNCFSGRPPYVYGAIDTPYPLGDSACNYDDQATHHDGSCVYKERLYSDCDNDAYYCLTDEWLGCPPYSHGGSEANHPDPSLGYPNNGCSWLPNCAYSDSIYCTDNVEAGAAYCSCSAPSTIDSFEIGKCITSVGASSSSCKGGINDYHLTGQFGCDPESFDYIYGGHQDCPNFTNSITTYQYVQGEIIPAFRDNCGQCMDPMCYRDFQGELGREYGMYHSTNGTMLYHVDFNGEPTGEINNPCATEYDSLPPMFYNPEAGGSGADFVPSNPNWNMSCSGCINEGSENYGGINIDIPCNGNILENNANIGSWDFHNMYSFWEEGAFGHHCPGHCELNPTIECSEFNDCYRNNTYLGDTPCDPETDQFDGCWSYGACMFGEYVYNPPALGEAQTFNCLQIMYRVLESDEWCDILPDGWCEDYGFSCPPGCQSTCSLVCSMYGEDNNVEMGSYWSACSEEGDGSNRCDCYCNVVQSYPCDDDPPGIPPPVFWEYIGQCVGGTCQGGANSGESCGTPDDCGEGGYDYNSDGCCNSIIDPLSYMDGGCCCYDYRGCLDKNSISFDPDALEDCIGAPKIDCLFGFDDKGHPKDVISTGLNFTMWEGDGTVIADTIPGWPFDYHRVVDGSYIRIGNEVVKFISGWSSSQIEGRYYFYVVRGMWNTEDTDHIGIPGYVEHRNFCNFQCCNSYIVHACTDPTADNYYCWYSHLGLEVNDPTLCPEFGLLPNCLDGDVTCEPHMDTTSGDNYDRNFITACDGASHSDTTGCSSGDDNCCCEYRHDCAGYKCNGRACNKTTGNAFYDFCGNCVGGETGMLEGFVWNGCGCEFSNGGTWNSWTQLTPLPPTWYFDGDGDGYGCSNLVVNANVSQALSEMYSEIYASGNRPGYCISDPDKPCFTQYIPTHHYGQCGMGGGSVNDYGCQQDFGTIQCDGGYDDCAGWNASWGWKYCEEGPKYYIKDTTVLNDLSLSWWYSETPGYRECSVDDDCAAIDPSDPNCVYLTSEDFGCATMPVEYGVCRNDSTDEPCGVGEDCHCAHPGWQGSTEVGPLCECYTNYFDCNGDCTTPGVGPTWDSCGAPYEACGGASIGCTGPICPIDEPDCEETDKNSYYIFRGSRTDVTCLEWLHDTGKISAEYTCEDEETNTSGNYGADFTCGGECGEECYSTTPWYPSFACIVLIATYGCDHTYEDTNGNFWYIADYCKVECDNCDPGAVCKNIGQGVDSYLYHYKYTSSCDENGINCIETKDLDNENEAHYCNYYHPLEFPDADPFSNYDCNCDCGGGFGGAAFLDDCLVCANIPGYTSQIGVNKIDVCTNCTGGVPGELIVSCADQYHPYDNPISYADGKEYFGNNLDCNCECNPGTLRYRQIQTSIVDYPGLTTSLVGYGEAKIEFPFGDTSQAPGLPNSCDGDNVYGLCAQAGLCGSPTDDFGLPADNKRSCGCTGGRVPQVWRRDEYQICDEGYEECQGDLDATDCCDCNSVCDGLKTPQDGHCTCINPGSKGATNCFVCNDPRAKNYVYNGWIDAYDEYAHCIKDEIGWLGNVATVGGECDCSSVADCKLNCQVCHDITDTVSWSCSSNHSLTCSPVLPDYWDEYVNDANVTIPACQVGIDCNPEACGECKIHHCPSAQPFACNYNGCGDVFSINYDPYSWGGARCMNEWVFGNYYDDFEYYHYSSHPERCMADGTRSQCNMYDMYSKTGGVSAVELNDTYWGTQGKKIRTTDDGYHCYSEYEGRECEVYQLNYDWNNLYPDENGNGTCFCTGGAQEGNACVHHLQCPNHYIIDPGYSELPFRWDNRITDFNFTDDSYGSTTPVQTRIRTRSFAHNPELDASYWRTGGQSLAHEENNMAIYLEDGSAFLNTGVDGFYLLRSAVNYYRCEGFGTYLGEGEDHPIDMQLCDNWRYSATSPGEYNDSYADGGYYAGDWKYVSATDPAFGGFRNDFYRAENLDAPTYYHWGLSEPKDRETAYGIGLKSVPYLGVGNPICKKEDGTYYGPFDGDAQSTGGDWNINQFDHEGYHWIGLTLDHFAPAFSNQVRLSNHDVVFKMKIPENILYDRDGDLQIEKMHVVVGDTYHPYGWDKWWGSNTPGQYSCPSKEEEDESGGRMPGASAGYTVDNSYFWTSYNFVDYNENDTANLDKISGKWVWVRASLTGGNAITLMDGDENGAYEDAGLELPSTGGYSCYGLCAVGDTECTEDSDWYTRLNHLYYGGLYHVSVWFRKKHVAPEVDCVVRQSVIEDSLWENDNIDSLVPGNCRSEYGTKGGINYDGLHGVVYPAYVNGDALGFSLYDTTSIVNYNYCWDGPSCTGDGCDDLLGVFSGLTYDDTPGRHGPCRCYQKCGGDHCYESPGSCHTDSADGDEADCCNTCQMWRKCHSRTSVSGRTEGGDCSKGGWGHGSNYPTKYSESNTGMHSGWGFANIYGSSNDASYTGGDGYKEDYIWFDNFRVASGKPAGALGSIEVVSFWPSNGDFGQKSHDYCCLLFWMWGCICHDDVGIYDNFFEISVMDEKTLSNDTSQTLYNKLRHNGMSVDPMSKMVKWDYNTFHDGDHSSWMDTTKWTDWNDEHATRIIWKYSHEPNRGGFSNGSMNSGNLYNLSWKPGDVLQSYRDGDTSPGNYTAGVSPFGVQSGTYYPDGPLTNLSLMIPEYPNPADAHMENCEEDVVIPIYTHSVSTHTGVNYQSSQCGSGTRASDPYEKGICTSRHISGDDSGGSSECLDDANLGNSRNWRDTVQHWDGSTAVGNQTERGYLEAIATYPDEASLDEWLKGEGMGIFPDDEYIYFTIKAGGKQAYYTSGDGGTLFPGENSLKDCSIECNSTWTRPMSMWSYALPKSQIRDSWNFYSPNYTRVKWIIWKCDDESHYTNGAYCNKVITGDWNEQYNGMINECIVIDNCDSKMDAGLIYDGDRNPYVMQYGGKYKEAGYDWYSEAERGKALSGNPQYHTEIPIWAPFTKTNDSFNTNDFAGGRRYGISFAIKITPPSLHHAKPTSGIIEET